MLQCLLEPPGTLKLFTNTTSLTRNASRRPLQPVVLVVDDDYDARFLYSRYLTLKGCVVYTARNGSVAIARAKSRRPDIIVMDLAMPRLDGFAAATRLKDAPITRSIPIIALSALPGSRKNACAAGCDAFLAKPCLPEMLWCEIQLVLGGNAAGP